jgi:hypothetical protein
MNTKSLIDLLDNLLPDQRILKDVNHALKEEIEKGRFSDLSPEEIPSSDVALEIINKRFINSRYEVGFGNHYICRVAVGGVQRNRNGIIVPKYFFATLHYTDDLRLITIDFHDEPY